MITTKSLVSINRSCCVHSFEYTRQLWARLTRTHTSYFFSQLWIVYKPWLSFSLEFLVSCSFPFFKFNKFNACEIISHLQLFTEIENYPKFLFYFSETKSIFKTCIYLKEKNDALLHTFALQLQKIVRFKKYRYIHFALLLQKIVCFFFSRNTVTYVLFCDCKKWFVSSFQEIPLHTFCFATVEIVRFFQEIPLHTFCFVTAQKIVHFFQDILLHTVCM